MQATSLCISHQCRDSDLQRRVTQQQQDWCASLVQSTALLRHGHLPQIIKKLVKSSNKYYISENSSTNHWKRKRQAFKIFSLSAFVLVYSHSTLIIHPAWCLVNIIEAYLIGGTVTSWFYGRKKEVQLCMQANCCVA